MAYKNHCDHLASCATYHAKNRIAINRRQRLYYKRHRAALLASARIYAAQHREQKQAYNKMYAEKNKEALRKKKRAAYLRKAAAIAAQKRKKRKEDGRYRSRLMARDKKYWASERGRDTTLRRKYGIGLADKSALFQLQGGRCALCNAAFTDDSAAVVDHCHLAGKVRGLLCRLCNLGLAHVESGRFACPRALAYLANPPAKQLGIYASPVVSPTLYIEKVSA